MQKMILMRGNDRSIYIGEYSNREIFYCFLFFIEYLI